MQLKINALAILGGVMLCACASTPPRPDQAELDSYITLTKPVRMVADTQEHEITGLPAILKGGLFDRTLTEVTIRPPQQALFGRMILADAIRWRPSGDDQPELEPVIHFGDLLDLSCRSELARMGKILDLAGENWVMAPGNHDGLAMGIFNFSSDGGRLVYGSKAWDYECRTPKADGDTNHDGANWPEGYFASSDVFIDWYLSKKHLPRWDLPQHQPRPDPLVVPFWPKDDPTKTEAERCATLPGELLHWTKPSDPKAAAASGVSGLVEEVYARIEHRSRCPGALASRSFVLQKIALPQADGAPLKVSLILLDTTQTDLRFDGLGLGLFADMNLANEVEDNPGNMGYLLDDQIAALKKMIENQGDEILIFGGHHNWDQLSPDSRLKLEAALAETKNPLVYISAHTHAGYWRRHAFGGRHVLELNLSSLADWPIAFRELQVKISPDRKDLLILAPLNGKKFTPAGEGQPSLSDQLVKNWVDHCSHLDLGESFSRFTQENLDIVTRQRAERQTWRMFADSAILYRFHHAAPDWENYSDKFNDMEKATEVLGLAADLNHPFGDRLQPLFKPILDQAKPCTKSTKRECIQAAWDEAHEAALADSAQKYYGRASLFIHQAQGIIDQTTDPDERTYMACTAVSAALADASLQENREPDRLTLDPTFYVDSNVATW